MMNIGHMLQQWLTKLEWFSTLFPRIPVPIQKQIETKLNNYYREHNLNAIKNVQSQPEESTDRRQISSAQERRGECGERQGGERRMERNEREYDRYDRNEGKRPNRSRSRSREKYRRYGFQPFICFTSPCSIAYCAVANCPFLQ